MRLLARLHPFLIVTVLLVAIFVGGVFWEAPFQTGAQGVARLFSQVWEYAFWPVRLVVTRLEGAGVDVTTTITSVILVCYVGLLVLLDIIIFKTAGGESE